MRITLERRRDVKHAVEIFLTSNGVIRCGRSLRGHSDSESGTNVRNPGSAESGPHVTGAGNRPGASGFRPVIEHERIRPLEALTILDVDFPCRIALKRVGKQRTLPEIHPDFS